MRDSHRGVVAASIRPVVETLEDRRLLSVSLLHGALKVTGGAGDDTIILSADTKRITVGINGVNKRFTKTQVKTISILSGDGADTITINSGIKQQITIKAGEGNDTVNGGTGREIIFGQGDDDSLLGNGGSDQIQGGNGNDTIDGGSSSDYLYGDAGDDNISGGTGNDVLAGDLEDTLVSKGAPPMVAGNDNLNGGDGNDWLLSERRITGTDPDTHKWVFASNGTDTFTGGSGADIIDIGATHMEGDNPVNDDTIIDRASEDYVPMFDAPSFSENGTTDVHNHAVLQLKVKVGSAYRNLLIQPNLGFFSLGFPSDTLPGFLSGLHTHDTTGEIHHEAPTGSSQTYELITFFENMGISMDKNHLGRLLPPPGKKMSMVVTRNARSTFSAGKWTTRGGTTFNTTAFGSFIVKGSGATGTSGQPGDILTGDIIQIRVG